MSLRAFLQGLVIAVPFWFFTDMYSLSSQYAGILFLVGAASGALHYCLGIRARAKEAERRRVSAAIDWTPLDTAPLIGD